MRVAVKKWGNSASVRIPAAVMAAAGLQVDDTVEIREEGGRVVIEPIRPREYVLEELVAAITDENRHELLDWGPPRGREVW